MRAGWSPFGVTDLATGRTFDKRHPAGHKCGGSFRTKRKRITLAVHILRETIVVSQRYTFIV